MDQLSLEDVLVLAQVYASFRPCHNGQSCVSAVRRSAAEALAINAPNTPPVAAHVRTKTCTLRIPFNRRNRLLSRVTLGRRHVAHDGHEVSKLGKIHGRSHISIQRADQVRCVRGPEFVKIPTLAVV